MIPGADLRCSELKKNEEKALKCQNKFLPLYVEKRKSMRKKDLETYLGKSALVYALSRAFDLNRGCGCEFWYPEEEDWIKFTFDGHRCKLLSVDGVDYDKCTIKMTVLTGGEVVSLEEVRVHHFRYNVLERIVKEYYMCSGACHNDTWESDVDEFLKDNMADFFDMYDQFMGY